MYVHTKSASRIVPAYTSSGNNAVSWGVQVTVLWDSPIMPANRLIRTGSCCEACGQGWERKRGGEKLVRLQEGRSDRNLFC
jgi:hypothetical protein